ncbi:hypothetical protein AnigIFM59636_003873 [Aspergillus niger]|nr:hypothetical protein AnigIFM59636_003873 [Aspergillus niger]
MAPDHSNLGQEEADNEKIDSDLRQLEAVHDTHFYNIDHEIEKKVVRKLDCVILPLMVLVYFFQCQRIVHAFTPRQADNQPGRNIRAAR